jgi:hypothetical protein
MGLEMTVTDILVRAVVNAGCTFPVRGLMKVPILLAFLLATAQAAEPTGTLTLACQGEYTWKSPVTAPEWKPISMGIIANFTEEDSRGFHGTVEGFHGIRARILVIDETKVLFTGNDKGDSISGSIDRVTGDVSAVHKTDDSTMETEYSLKCKPTQRMF